MAKLSAPDPTLAIVDDDEAVLGSLDSLMRSVDKPFYGFTCAEELLSHDALDKISCIVTDLNLTGMSGLDLVDRLNARNWKGRIIMMTAFPTDAVQKRAQNSGVNAFFTKPVNPEDLLSAIEMA